MQVMSQNLDCLCRSVMRAWIPACAGMTSKRIVAVGLLAMTTSSLAREPSTLDDFSDASQWRVIASNQVSGKIRSIDDGADGKALCLDYDFNGVSGYVGLQRDLSLDYPDNYRFDFQLRGDSPGNDLQFKLIDASGDNVWWVNRPKYVYPKQWTPVRFKRRHINKAWGPDADPVLHHSAKLEFTVYNNAGGKGSVCFDSLTFTPLPADDHTPYAPSARVMDAQTMRDADNSTHARLAVDRDVNTALSWNSENAALEPLVLDLGKSREFGGLVLQWGRDYASGYEISISDDGHDWQHVRSVESGNGGRDWLALPESEARYIRLTATKASGKRIELAEVEVEPLAFAATDNDFLKSVAKDTPRGTFPRGFSGEQPYWTILGIDGGTEQGLIGEDGAVEVGKGGFSIEPFVQVDDALLDWADVQVTQSLQDGYLPIPSVQWQHGKADLRITAFAEGQPARSQLVARYVLRNPGKQARDYTLALVLRPLQVNPPSQFLNITGGVSRIESLDIKQGVASVDGKPRVYAAQSPDAAFASSFDAGMAVTHLGDAVLPRSTSVDDATGLASAAMLYRMRLQPGETKQVDIFIPMTGEPACRDGRCDAAQLQAQVAELWRAKLDRVSIEVPQAGQALVDALRTATAHMLISRSGPRLQPGTRSYARSWIRDGAMISEGLLRMGRPEVVRDYVEFFAPYQFDNGKVPCCVDDRGSDPVPENDSHGELIFNIAEYYRYTGDKAFLAAMWPHVRGAFEYMEQLRLSERTDVNRKLNPAFYGMMPASISHEGYSAKPVHSYWDDFWALRGYKDAVEVASALGKQADAKRMAAARDQFRSDLQASLLAAVKFHDIDYLPGSAELGDFDPTSTTIALAPAGEQASLPQVLLHDGFERYWREFVQRRDGLREWKDYTPYEWRNVGAFVRLGWRERTWEAVQFFFDDRAPKAWNQWGEVVSHTPRTSFFLGDLPHAWVASDFVRSALDMFAYTREADDSIVLAAGVPVAWLDGKGIAVNGLRTPYGKLTYSLRRLDRRVLLDAGDGMRLPVGGLVLPWPYGDGKPGATTINGKPAAWKDGELRIETLPAKVEIAL